MRKNLGSDENNMDLVRGALSQNLPLTHFEWRPCLLGTLVGTSPQGIRKDTPLLQPRSVADSHPADHEESSGYHGGDPDCRMYSVKGGGVIPMWANELELRRRGEDLVGGSLSALRLRMLEMAIDEKRTGWGRKKGRIGIAKRFRSDWNFFDKFDTGSKGGWGKIAERNSHSVLVVILSFYYSMCYLLWSIMIFSSQYSRRHTRTNRSLEMTFNIFQ